MPFTVWPNSAIPNLIKSLDSSANFQGIERTQENVEWDRNTQPAKLTLEKTL